MRRLALFALVGLVLGATARADNPSLPSLQVTTLEGRPFDLATHRGKWVVVNWWATWCVPCIKELPEISAFATKHRDKVVAIGLAFEDSEKAEIVDFLAKRPLAFAVAQVDPNDPPKDFGAPLGLPNTYVIGPDGRIAREFLGPVTAKDLDGVIGDKSR
jgi:thiol-disulfide isomerase/thioredoxin